MKKSTHYLRTIAIFCLLAATQLSIAQTPCNSSFVYTVAPTGGQVTFSSTATNVTGATGYTWTIYALTYFQGQLWSVTQIGTLNGINPTSSFSVNGTYSVNLAVTNYSPFCMAQSSQTIAVTGTNVPCSVAANFSVAQGSGGAVTLINTSTGTVSATSYSWNFGDNTTGTGISPVHTYSADGVYWATLIANNNFTSSCTSTVVKQVKICSVQPMNSSFVYTNLPNGVVSFTSTSTGTNPNTVYYWYDNYSNTYFGSGTNVTQASKSYTSNGAFPATLWIQNQVTTCSVSSTQSVVVTNTVTPCNLYAGFTTNQGSNGLVNFINTSQVTTTNSSYFWNFGDNTTGTSFSPAHTYPADGVYIVTLNVNNNTANTCTATYSTSIKVCSYAQLTSSFTYSTSGNTISLTSTSTGTNSGTVYNWTRSGFGTIASGLNLTQTTNTVSGNGVYYISLQAVNPVSTCSSTTGQTIAITNASCVANANFSLVPTATAQVWYATVTSPGNVTSAVWSWGDGSTTNYLYASHTYSAAGTYSICLSVTVSCGSSNTYCNAYYVFRSSEANQDQSFVQINVIDAASVGIKNNTSKETTLIISPNPSNGSFQLQLDGVNGATNIVIYDLTGKIIYEQVLQTNNAKLVKEINMTEFPAGLYFVRTKSGNDVVNKKIVVEK